MARGASSSILVTGGAGFIGSNFIPYFLNRYPQYRIINLDNLSYAGNWFNLKEVENHPRHKFIKGDIGNRELLEYIFREYNIQGVINFAAETHVDNSISGPGIFVETNIKGAFTLLDICRNYWMDSPHHCKPGCEKCRFYQISTDEVYGSLGEVGCFSENSPYAPNSPYSASKASADMLVRGYFHTYGMNVVTSHCSNNYGPGQHQEKLIPTIIRTALAGDKIPIYGDGKNIRDWLYVLDHCRAVDLVYHRGRPGETYNVGGGCECDNLSMATGVCAILDRLATENKNGIGINSFSELIAHVPDRPGHDRRYAIDAAKIRGELGWKAEEVFASGILKTVEWYLKHGN